MASKLCWCVNTKKALQTILSHLFTQWQFPCSLNRYDFLFRIYAGFSGSRDPVYIYWRSMLLLQYTRDFWCFAWLLLRRVWNKPKEEGKNIETQITCSILYSHDWSTIAYTCENIRNVGLLLDCQTKSLINVNAKNSPSFRILFIFSLIFCVCFEYLFLSFLFFAFGHWNPKASNRY